MRGTKRQEGSADLTGLKSWAWKQLRGRVVTSCVLKARGPAIEA